jgi:hypothetical protein
MHEHIIRGFPAARVKGADGVQFRIAHYQGGSSLYVPFYPRSNIGIYLAPLTWPDSGTMIDIVHRMFGGQGFQLVLHAPLDARHELENLLIDSGLRILRGHPDDPDLSD